MAAIIWIVILSIGLIVIAILFGVVNKKHKTKFESKETAAIWEAQAALKADEANKAEKETKKEVEHGQNHSQKTE